ncbi:MAG: trypsin-like serine protease [Gammaproteobacteria bacterium]|nr:trypsin-like serine protease [Gammaproteobacteria bacterium]
MKTIVLVLAFLPCMALAATPEQAVVKLKMPSGSFCSGVVVNGDLVLTAEHCGCENNVEVLFRDGTSMSANGVYDPPKNSRDQVTVYRMTKSTTNSVAVGTKRPDRGDEVRSVGYPGGKFSIVEGEVTSSSAKYLWTDFWILEGNSGGGLFNASGNLVGIASARTGLGDRPGSVFVPVEEIHASLKAVSEEMITNVDYTSSSEVVVFTTPDCAPCDRLKADIKAGYFKKFNIRLVEYRAGVWSDPELVSEFFAAAPNDVEPAFPMIWVRGTNNYRVGYSPTRRGGVIGFLTSVLRGLTDAVLGVASPKDFPQPYRRVPGPPDEEAAIVPVPATELEASLNSLREDIAKLKSSNPIDKIKGAVAMKSDLIELKEAVTKNNPDSAAVNEMLADVSLVKEDLAKLKSGNPIQKIAALASLKGEVSKLRADAEDVKDKAKEDPLLFLLGLPGLLTGLLHRRMAA